MFPDMFSFSCKLEWNSTNCYGVDQLGMINLKLVFCLGECQEFSLAGGQLDSVLCTVVLCEFSKKVKITDGIGCQENIISLSNCRYCGASYINS